MEPRMFHEEDGLALPGVLLALIILAMLSSLLATFATEGQQQARESSEWHAALAAAEAGLDDYLFRLNNEGDYWEYSTTSPDPDNDAFTQFVPIPGPASGGEFTYNVDSTGIATDGNVVVTSTGRVNGESRTVRATLRREGFLDYLYFTNLETSHPEIVSSDPNTQQQVRDSCGRWAHGPNPRAGWCTNIVFATGENINGPLRTNDRIVTLGSPDFNGVVETHYPTVNANGGCIDGRYVRSSSSGGCPRFNDGVPVESNQFRMPPSNRELRLFARKDIGETGCLYTGPTYVRFLADGRADITSPFTPDDGSRNCGVGRNVTFPADWNGVIYVESVAAGQTLSRADAGIPGGSTTQRSCPFDSHPFQDTAFVNSDPGTNDFASNDGDWGGAVRNRFVYNGWISGSRYALDSYGCRDGDAFVWGEIDGRATLGAENRIAIVQDLVYEDPADDVLGLIANSFVEVYHPVACLVDDGRCRRVDDIPYLDDKYPGRGNYLTNVRIDAAILSVNASFTTANYRYGGQLGDIDLFGAISQGWRGPVGVVGSSGYAKQYTYDSKLKYLSPPRFINPVEAAWQIREWAETT